MRIKGISSLLLAVLCSLTGYAHDVDSNTGKSGYLTEPFFLFQMNSDKQLLQWDSDLGGTVKLTKPTRDSPQNGRSPAIAQLTHVTSLQSEKARPRRSR